MFGMVAYALRVSPAGRLGSFENAQISIRAFWISASPKATILIKNRIFLEVVKNWIFPKLQNCISGTEITCSWLFFKICSVLSQLNVAPHWTTFWNDLSEVEEQMESKWTKSRHEGLHQFWNWVKFSEKSTQKWNFYVPSADEILTKMKIL